MPTVTINDTSVFYRTFGDAAAPPLVLVHGLYGDSSGTTPVAERLAAHFFVIAPDAIGHGRSEHPAHFTIEDQGRMLNALPAVLGVAADVLVGISMGAYLAAQAAVLKPALWRRLVLVVGKAQGVTSSSAAYAARRGVDLTTLDPEALLELMQEALWSPDTPAEQRAEIMAAQPIDEAVVLTAAEKAAVERSLAGFDLRPGLGAIATPTLVLSGRADGLNPPEAGAELARGISDARFDVYEHAGHMLPYEQPDRFAADVVAFAGE